jgi:hypothetical protein
MYNHRLKRDFGRTKPKSSIFSTRLRFATGALMQTLLTVLSKTQNAHPPGLANHAMSQSTA